MRGWLGWVLIAAGCAKGEGTDTPIPTTDTGDSTTTTTTTSETDPVDPHTLYDCWADVTVDEGDDGTVDQLWFDGMDAAEPTWLVFREGDSNSNGVVDFFEQYARDALGNVTRFERQGTGAASYDATYDAAGNVLFYGYDADADGDYDYTYAATWDANGEVLRYERDDDGDGALDYWYEFTRTPDGYRETAIESVDGDESVDFTYAYSRDEVEREIQIERRDPSDAVVLLFTVTYSDPVLETGSAVYDDGNDGTIDGVSEFVGDEAGRRTHYALDRDPYDGAFDSVEDWEYDEAGQLTSFSGSYENDGDPYTAVGANTYDGLGRTIDELSSFVFESGLTFAERTRWTYGGTCP